MDIILVIIILATLIISLIAFIGIFSLAMSENLLRKILLALVSFSAGALMGGAFIHLLPEAVESSSFGPSVIIIALLGFVVFLVIEKALFWHHCHEGPCDVHTFRYMNLVGDGVHNLIDGLILAVAFITSVGLGITTAIAIAFHEIPPEMGDFGVLVYGGFKRRRALMLNFAVSTLIVVGGIIGYFVSSQVEGAVTYLLPFAAGGFIYVAATDLVPEIKHELDVKKSVATVLIFVGGIALMWLIKVIFPG
ncbi:MAG: ZIP family metal transporter [Methanobacteriota archaeon]|nr:MAG: ZIP family metal transporter [Euryarchaeota archaeon]